MAPSVPDTATVMTAANQLRRYRRRGYPSSWRDALAILGNAFALIDANGASGVRIQTIRGLLLIPLAMQWFLISRLPGKPSLGRYYAAAR